ncbi:hypothetical protein EV183_000035 [Coemansia sp. RSA 2336]|nr:hypothetical protein EV183_000657 [Coemansia sp. RSA 2336]KAJ2456479.1 hypothetical protein EV183_000035 [Coemansia sp. RSA 2336]
MQHAFVHPLDHDLAHGMPHSALGHRGRSDTGASSTGSAMHDQGSIASTTALSPASAQLGKSNRFATPRSHAAAQFASSEQSKPPEMSQRTSALVSHFISSASGRRYSADEAKSFTGPKRPEMRFRHSEGDQGMVNQDIEIEDDEDDGTGRRKRRDDLRRKFKRAVIKASVITRKAPRQMKSAAAEHGMFPFLQDAMFVPMFHFMRDEHGHRAPPVIFDAIQLSINMPGEIPTMEEDHHFSVRIALQYGDVKWVIYRRLNDFLSLHTMLTLRRFQGRVHQLPAFPQQLSYALEKALSLKPGHTNSQPSGRMLQATVDRKQALENYLIKLLRALNMRPAYELCTFLELSAVSIMKDVGWKGKEGNLDRRVEHITGKWCTPHDLRRWSRQWVLVRDSFIAFCNHISDPYPSDVMFADPEFDLKFRKKKGHNPLFPYRITMSNQYRRIQLRSDSERVITEWRNSITEMKNSSAWAVPHRFDSFAPIRDNSRMIWFVDGDDYFYALSEALENATDCIYIGDWWLSPEVHLRRPPALNEEYRIDRLLKRKAEEGVKIFVAIYKEVTVSLTINSAYTKRKLQSLHPNIMVQRHPDHLAGGTMFWAHHEKMVIVDNTFAFMGGLDLCWGRYDTHGHRLADYYLPANNTPYSHLQNFFGQDYNNARIHDFANVNDYESTLIDRRTTPRMPWHDVHMAMIGQPARDVARHFIQRWNFIKSSKGMNKTHMPFLMPKGEYSATRNDLQYRGTCRTQLLRSSAEWSMGINKESSIHTAYCEMIRDAKHFIYIENQFFVSNAREDPGYTIKNRIAEALVDRVKRAHKRGEKFHVIIVIPLMPAFEGDVNAVGAATLKLVMHWQYQSICRGDHSIASQLEKEGIDMHQYIRFFGLRNYDVIRRYADGAMQQDVLALAGNAPAEAPGFNEALRKQNVPEIKHTAEAAQHEPSSEAAAKLPSPEAASSIHRPETIANVRDVERSLSFTTPDYGFQRPDEAFAEDTLPMQDNRQRPSQELTRPSQELPERHHSHFGHFLHHHHEEKSDDGDTNKSSNNSSQPNTESRRSFNLPRRPTGLRQRASFSALRGFLTGDRSGSEHPTTLRSQSRAPSTSSSSSSSSSSHSDGESLSSDDYEVPGRRKNAFRYLVRGTEHIKQYGWQRRGGRGHAANGGDRLHRRMYKHGTEERRDSDSEFGGSNVRVDMDDVENYVHPPKTPKRDPSEATFLRGSPAMAAEGAGRQQTILLPEDTGTEYMRQCKQAEQSSSQAEGKPATKPQPARPVASGSTSAKQPQQPKLNVPTYPPQPTARLGPQVLEHEVRGFEAPKAAAAAATTPAAPAAEMPSAEAEQTGTEPVAGGEVVDQVVTELVYVHCKLMIVDDRYVIMGSANINDRSMCGNRDSEIAMVIEDTEPVVTTMDGRPYQAAKFAHSLRVQLCQEHCGLLESFDQLRFVNEMFAGNPPIDTTRSEEEKQQMQQARKAVEDPLSDAFMHLWWDTATTNERVFRDVFRCVPDDTVETFDQYKKFIPGHSVPHGHALPSRSTAETLQMLKSVRGHLVPMPLKFLRQENLGAKLGDKEILVPVEVFT